MGAPKGGCQNYGYVTLARGTKTLLAIDRRTANIYYFDDPHSGLTTTHIHLPTPLHSISMPL